MSRLSRFGAKALLLHSKSFSKTSLSPDSVDAVGVRVEARRRQQFLTGSDVCNRNLATVVAGGEIALVGRDVEVDPLIRRHLPFNNVQNGAQISHIPAEDFGVLKIARQLTKRVERNLNKQRLPSQTFESSS